MTTPFERQQALRDINTFIGDLVYMRSRADRGELVRKLLRHYPTNMEITMLLEGEGKGTIWPEPKQK